tara:strand:- start:1460 stop:1723 length:264 start_codon:yes stop_codon:yes gene_type:complete
LDREVIYKQIFFCHGLNTVYILLLYLSKKTGEQNMSIKKQNKKITIPISECDIQDFEKLIHNNYDPFTWTFDGVDVEFIKEEMEDYE